MGYTDKSDSEHCLCGLKKEPWPLDPNFSMPLIVDLSMWKNRTALEILNLYKQSGEIIYEASEHYEPWPVDPNAPIIRDWRGIVITPWMGHIGFAELSAQMFAHKLPDVIAVDVDKIKHRREGKEPPFPKPNEFVIQNTIIGYEDIKVKGNDLNKVTPREQRRRERFRRK